MERKKRFSILKLLISIICIAFIALSLSINILFSGDKVPNLFGKYFYVVDSSSEGEGVTPGALIIANDAADTDIVIGDIVLCKEMSSESSGEEYTYSVRGIIDIADTEDGQRNYALGIGTTPLVDEAGDRIVVNKDSIAALCTGSTQSLELGKFIKFTASIKGILLELILPCAILVIFLIAKIARSSNKDEEEYDDYNFYEYDEDENADGSGIPSHEKQNGPLFEPSQEIQPSNDFERKKMSIAENFSQKEVDHNSSYQKEKERTMQFKAQKGIPNGPAESLSANYRARQQSTSSAESSFAARNMSGQSSTAPTADALREKMLRETAEAERGGSYNTKTYGRNSSSDVTGVFSKSQLAEIANQPASKRPAVSHMKKSTSPDIDDIIVRSNAEAKKKSSSGMSVDDLLKLIEDEKNKL